MCDAESIEDQAAEKRGRKVSTTTVSKAKGKKRGSTTAGDGAGE